jgi:hypothetical protein
MYDFASIVKQSRRFYKEYGLADWAAAIPRQPFPARDVETLLEQAARSEFTEAFAFPPFAVQMATFDRLIDGCARQPATLLPDSQQYREPFLADNWSREANGKVLQRTADLGERDAGPYVFLFTPSPLANCWGKTGKQIAEQFRARGWHGLTAPEYLVLQRRFAEQYRDHRFFVNGEDPTAHWLWLIDSMNDTDCSVAYGSSRGVNIQAAAVNNRESKRAAIAGVIVPLAAR